MTELEVHQGGNALALDDAQPFWNDHQIAALRQLGVDRATNGDLAVFHHVCQRTGLDPFARQIYMIERQGKQTIQTGIDGFRLVARRAVDRSGETLSIGASEWADENGAWHDVWLKSSPPKAARVVVMRDGQPFTGTALWSEYAQTKRDGELTAMWAARPAGQLAKCAEALALRKAFPHDLSGIYSDDEMAREERRQVIERRAGLGAVINQPSDPAGPSQVDSPDSASTPTGSVDTPAGSEPEDAEVVDELTDKTRKTMFALFGERGIDDRERQIAGIIAVIGRQIESRAEITETEAHMVIASLRSQS